MAARVPDDEGKLGMMQMTIANSDAWWSGLQVKTYWTADEAVQEWTPAPGHPGIEHTAYDDGMVAQQIYAHCAFLAAAATATLEEGHWRIEPASRFAIASADLLTSPPAPANQPLTIRARIHEVHPTKIVVTCVLRVNDTEHARLRVTVVRPALNAT